MRHIPTHNADFVCQHCRQYVSANPYLAGAQNRNHCPYCLWSRHLDLFEAGDRLSACRGSMRPIGLTAKASRNKYRARAGELMLIHHCVECGKLSINRIAADDIADYVYEVFEDSLSLPQEQHIQLAVSNITLLGEPDADLVELRLFGAAGEPHPEPIFDFEEYA
jgi:hypothetical protein